MLNQTTEWVGLQQIDLSAFVDTMNNYLGTFSNVVDELFPQMIRVTSNLLSSIVTGFFSIILSIYIMNGKERLLEQIKRVLCAYLPEWLEKGVSELTGIISQVFGDYFVGQCKEAVILGCLCFAGMMILRLDYAGLVSIIVTFGALIPIVGAFVAGAVGVVLLLLVSPGEALIFLIFLVVLQQIEGNVIYPKLVGRKIGLPGIWVLLSISVWGGLFGMWGMLLGVPLTTICYQLFGRAVRNKERTEMKK
ncbi:MAG: AI-2E family transporter [Lachnospiraceae bacterium]|nr:AI-2E family transporter [Lachnospiraceae bacterium]